MVTSDRPIRDPSLRTCSAIWLHELPIWPYRRVALIRCLCTVLSRNTSFAALSCITQPMESIEIASSCSISVYCSLSTLVLRFRVLHFRQQFTPSFPREARLNANAKNVTSVHKTGKVSQATSHHPGSVGSGLCHPAVATRNVGHASLTIPCLHHTGGVVSQSSPPVLHLVRLFLHRPTSRWHGKREVIESTQPNGLQKHHEARLVQQASEQAIQLAYT